MSERFIETAHFHGDGIFGYEFMSVERPRVSFKDTCFRKTRSTVREWRVDGEAVELDQIGVALAKPPVLTDEETVVLEQIGIEWADRRKDLPYSAMLGLRKKGFIEAKAGKVRLAPQPPVGQNEGEG